LVGGSVPVHEEIVLSLRKLNRIINFDPTTGVLHCEAGCILEELQNYVGKEYGYVMPLDLGAKGSCQIGGNLATNAGGIKFIKYNSMHANTLGLTAVTASGQTLSDISEGVAGIKQ
jgi:FAD/FMN-containing dehydrogenase